MGKQIEVRLDAHHSHELVEYLRQQFPIRIIDRYYPPEWDGETVHETPGAADRVIVDERVQSLVVSSATPLYKSETGYPVGVESASTARGWQVRSVGESCIDWSSEPKPYGVNRLYLNTYDHPVGQAVRARIGSDVERTFERAKRWIKRHCVPLEDGQSRSWISESLRDSVRYDRAEHDRRNLLDRVPDPRDDRFYELQGRKPRKLTTAELAELLQYCEAMLQYGGPWAEHSWRTLISELEAEARRRQPN